MTIGKKYSKGMVEKGFVKASMGGFKKVAMPGKKKKKKVKALFS